MLDDLTSPDAQKTAIFPVLSLFNREFLPRDGFVPDCDIHHSVRQFPHVSENREFRTREPDAMLKGAPFGGDETLRMNLSTAPVMSRLGSTMPPSKVQAPGRLTFVARPYMTLRVQSCGEDRKTPQAHASTMATLPPSSSNITYELEFQHCRGTTTKTIISRPAGLLCYSWRRMNFHPQDRPTSNRKPACRVLRHLFESRPLYLPASRSLPAGL
jgi:hypothetical protein